MFEVVSGQIQRDWMKECEFTLARSPNDLFDFVSKATKVFGEDLETTSLNPEKARIVGFSCAYDEHHGLYYPISHTIGSDFNLPVGPFQEVVRELGGRPPSVLRNVWWNYSGYDGEILQKVNLEQQYWDDGMIAVFLENSNHLDYRLKPTALRMLGIEMIEFEEVTHGRTFDQVHPEEATPYAASDACVNLRLWNIPSVQRTISSDPQYGQSFIYELERQVSYVLREGMQNKCWLDVQKLESLVTYTDRMVVALIQEIYQLAGREFDLGSPKVLGDVLLSLGIPITQRTGKTEQVETKKEVLLMYKRYHPIIEKIVQWKELSTQNRNYTLKLIAAANHFGPKVRFSFHHIGVPTGRMKCGGAGKGVEAYSKGSADVNIQSAPDPKKQAYLPNIRSAIVANDPRVPNAQDWCILSIDYSQVELRVAANLSREPAWIQEFARPNSDIHNKNAELAYRRKIDKSHSREEAALRDKGKTISFAVLYGGSAWTVAEHAGISIEQGQVLIDSFFAGARQLKSWIDSWIRMARANKMVKTYFGRIRHLDEFYTDKVNDRRLKARLWSKGDREAVNDPIQGGAADVFKIACVKVAKMLKERGWQNDCQHILYMHDELVFRCRVNMLDRIVPEIQRTMEFDVKGWPVRLVTEAEAGWNWGELKPIDKFVASLNAGVEVVEQNSAVDEPGELVSAEELAYLVDLSESQRDYGRLN